MPTPVYMYLSMVYKVRGILGNQDDDEAAEMMGRGDWEYVVARDFCSRHEGYGTPESLLHTISELTTSQAYHFCRSIIYRAL